MAHPNFLIHISQLFFPFFSCAGHPPVASASLIKSELDSGLKYPHQILSKKNNIPLCVIHTLLILHSFRNCLSSDSHIPSYDYAFTLSQHCRGYSICVRKINYSNSDGVQFFFNTIPLFCSLPIVATSILFSSATVIFASTSIFLAVLHVISLHCQLQKLNTVYRFPFGNIFSFCMIFAF